MLISRNAKVTCHNGLVAHIFVIYCSIIRVFTVVRGFFFVSHKMKEYMSYKTMYLINSKILNINFTK
jgi:hypothetical protein